MGTNTIDARMIAKMFLAGAKNLEAKKEWINELNVFPVPDGDTGTNMTLTIMSAAKEVIALEKPDMMTLAKAMSSGSLRGARGNSGVILSQLLRGFTKGIRDYDEVDATILANAMQKAAETAYKAVMKPKEGTILTVARGAADKAAELVETVDDLDEMFREIIKHAEFVLSQTPEMLPVLKQAGVVDSGGQGLLEVLKGAYDGFLGKDTEFVLGETAKGAPRAAERTASLDAQAGMEIKFGYCTEFIIMTKKEFTAQNEHEFKAYLESIGDSIVVVADDDIVKVHVHSNDPGLAIQKALTYGELTSMKIDNMREEHQEKLIKMATMQNTAEQSGAGGAGSAGAGFKEAAAPKGEASREKEQEEQKEYGFIAVSVGEGLDAIFKGLGVDVVIEGGQTMNPSTEDLLNAISLVHAKNIFILPNNKNIILAANQACSLTEGKNAMVVPTRTIPQGITALINFMPENSPEENRESMTEEIQNVKTGQVTYAVRDTVIDDKEIKQGNIMGIGDHNILAVGTIVEDTTKDMLDELVDDDSEIISIYYGKEVDEEIAGDFAETVKAAYPGCDVEIHFGGQPIYYYIVSVE